MKNWRTSFLALLLTIVMLGTSSAAFAANSSMGVVLNGQPVEFAAEQAPYIDENGTGLVPLQEAAEALGVTLANPAGSSVTMVVYGGQEVALDVKPVITGGVKYVPVRVFAEAAGYEVGWNEENRAVLLTAKSSENGGRGFLWEVQHEGNTVFLVGSMHIANNSFYPLHTSFEEAFAEAEYVGVEADVSKASSPEIQELVMKIGTYQDGTTLKDHISQETYAKLGEFLSQNGAPANAFDAYKPWMVEMAIAVMKPMQNGYQAEAGVDLHFLQKAMAKKLPIIELESFESQLNMFNSFSPELQEESLAQVLENSDKIVESVDQMAEIWKSGDDAGMLELIDSSFTNEEYRKAMLTDRNIAMADKIDGYLKNPQQADYFVVIGAGHFLGKDSIVELLEKKGYTVTRK